MKGLKEVKYALDIHELDYIMRHTLLLYISNPIMINTCKRVGNGAILIIPNDKNLYKLSDGALYFSVSQIVAEVL